MDGNWKQQVEADIDGVYCNGHYAELVQEARDNLLIRSKGNKPLIARWVAQRLSSSNQIPTFVTRLAAAIRKKLPEAIGPKPFPSVPPTPPTSVAEFSWDDDNTPF